MTKDEDQTTEPVTPDSTTGPTPEQIGQDVRTRREFLGISRQALAGLTDLTAAKVWRIEQGRPHEGEVPPLLAVLDGLEKDGLPEELRPKRKAPTATAKPSRAALEKRVTELAEALTATYEAKSLKAVKEIVRRVLEAEPAEGEVIQVAFDSSDNEQQ